MPILDFFRSNPRILAGAWFSFFGVVAAILVLTFVGWGPEIYNNLLAFCGGGVAGFFIFGLLIGKAILTPECKKLTGGFLGLGIAGFSLFSVGALTAFGLGLVELFQGLHRQALERFLVAIPGSLCYSVFAFIFYGWIVLPVGFAAGLLLAQFNRALLIRNKT